MTVLGGMDDDVGLSQARPEQALGALGAHDLFEDGHIRGVQDQSMGRIGDQLQTAVAIHDLGNLDEQGVGHLSHEVIEHVVDDRRCIAEIVRTLKPGGRLGSFSIAGENYAKIGGVIAKKPYNSAILGKNGDYSHNWTVRINTQQKTYNSPIVIKDVIPDAR